MSFPQAPECTITATSIFFENSRRYSRLKVQDTSGKWKIFKQKNFNSFVWTPLGSRVNIFLNFCLQVHGCLQPDIVAIMQICRRCRGVVDNGGNLPPASLTPLQLTSLTPVANLPPVSTTLAKMVAKFATGFVRDTGGAP
jgi:hypothetical protein